MFDSINQLFEAVKSYPQADKLTAKSDDFPIIKDVSIPEYDIDEGANKDDKFAKIPDGILESEYDLDKDCKFQGKLNNDKPHGKGTYTC